MAVRIAIEHHIGALPRTPFCLFEAFPLKGKREIWREKQGVIYFMYHSGVSPFGAFLSIDRPNCGGSPAQPDRGSGERSEPVSRIVFMSYDTESKSRNADFILIAP